MDARLGGLAVVSMTVTLGCGATMAPTDAIGRVLDAQVERWNAGDIDGFMEGYWRSDNLTFSAGGQTTRGWDATRQRYHERYANRAVMGRLSFEDLEVYSLERTAALALGRWRLQRDAGDVGGNFSLVLRRLPEGWRIVHDHTSVDASISATAPQTPPEGNE